MNLKFVIGLVFVFCAAVRGFAVPEEKPAAQLVYQTEMFGSGATGLYTPFWMVSNRYGMVPLRAGNAFLSAGMVYGGRLGGGFRWQAGLDLAVTAPRYRKVFVRQLYAELGWRSLLFSLGSREQAGFLWDRELSSGDMVLSANARPIPEVKIRIAEYTVVPGTGRRLFVKGDFSAGRSSDSRYLASFARSDQVYIEDVLWHHKSLFFKLQFPSGSRFPFALELGLQHAAQWGGVYTDGSGRRQPQSLTDFARVVAGLSGGEDATEMDRVNVLGNQYGSYDMRLTYKQARWGIGVYHQRYFEDKSGTIFGNGKDGLWGIQVDLPEIPWLQKIVAECMDTRHQSGPLHFLAFDHQKYPGIGGGADRYYNNEEYSTGLSYFNRSVGTPLLPSPEYNTDGKVGFKNTRVYAWHVGISGRITSRIAYRLLYTAADSWGTPYRPFLNNKTGTFALLEVTCRHPRLPGWTFTGSVASDTGTMLGGEGVGFGLRVAKRGILPIKTRQ
ncbi:MAG: capsule assembly Wzi family protein [Tannerellaceae bacterium]|jgi:hypothetical protein|nr:capsule assembly Wzi family protein [Tannerellaceae bacterium]